MRIAVLSDIHGNLTALEAVIADLRTAAPDLVVHGGDFVGSGGRIGDIIDRVRDLGWPGVVGNTDEMLWNRAPLDQLAARLPHLRPLWRNIDDDIAIAQQALDSRQLEWLRSLPTEWSGEGVTVVHATRGDPWNCPAASASDDAFAGAYEAVRAPMVVFGHLHLPFVRRVGRHTIANSGSVGMPFDGDPRAAYLLIDNGAPTIRRVPYDVVREIKNRHAIGHPRANAIARGLREGRREE